MMRGSPFTFMMRAGDAGFTLHLYDVGRECGCVSLSASTELLLEKDYLWHHLAIGDHHGLQGNGLFGYDVQVTGHVISEGRTHAVHPAVQCPICQHKHALPTPTTVSTFYPVVLR